MALVVAQKRQVTRNWIAENFVRADKKADQSSADVYAAVEAIDNLLEAQQAVFNTALPEPFKSTATPAQKASLFTEVMSVRYSG